MKTKPTKSKSEIAELLTAAKGHAQKGNAGIAAAVYQQVLDLDPKNKAALRGMATALLRDGQAEQSLMTIDRAIALEPDALELKTFRASALEQLGRRAEAMDAYSAVLALKPGDRAALRSRGRMLIAAGRADEAVADLEKARDIPPPSAEILCDLGGAYHENDRSMEAVAALDAALALKPDFAPAHYNRATALRRLLRLDEAMAAYRRALELDPQLTQAMVPLTEMLGERGDFEGALALSDRALRLAPHSAHAHQVRSLLMLRHGRLAEGFAALDWRLKPSRHMVTSRPFPFPAWRGEALTGKRIVLWTEQGIGDEIITAGMFPQVIAAAAHCTIECSERLAGLFRRSFPAADVVARRDPPAISAAEDFDFQSAAWSLGQWLRPGFDHFPRHDGYLKADAARAAALRARYQAAHPGKLLVGISWDSAARAGGAKRAPLDLWTPVFAVPGCAFVDLQYKPDTAARSPQPEAPLLADPSIDPMTDFDGAAAQIAAMDLVITISNTTAHTAGALGKPVWTLLPEGAASFWYWFRDRSDSPWYPAMLLFRQSQPGDWAPVMAAVAEKLSRINVGTLKTP